MAHDDGVRAHRLERQCRVLEGLALGHGRASRLEVDDVGAQALGGRLEGDAGTRRILEEEVDDGLPLKRRKLLDAVALCGGHLLRRVEDQDRLLAGHVADRNKMAQAHRLQALP